MRIRGIFTGALMLAALPATAQQSVVDQKAQADLDKVRADTAKVLIDTQKAKVDLDAATLAPLKSLTGGTATATAGEKTVEAMLLGKAATAGAAARLVEVLTASGVPTTQMPYVIVGTTPPSVSQWRLFERDRDKVKASLTTALADWSKVHSTKMAFGVIGVATLVATIVPLLKTDTTLTGASLSIENAEAEAAIHKALAQARYPVDVAGLEMMDGKAATDALLAPLADLHRRALDAYEQGFVPFYLNSKKPDHQAAGANLKTALAEYDALKQGLMTETSGVMSATVVTRQKALSDGAANRPLLYLTNRTLAFTTTTKKGLFTGFTSTPAFGSAGAVFDYVLIGAGVAPAKVRGSVSCVIARRSLASALALRAERMPAMGSALCDPSPPTP